jgi:hypothetical protein
MTFPKTLSMVKEKRLEKGWATLVEDFFLYWMPVLKPV